MNIVHQQLKKIFHHDDFQEGQEEIIRDLLEGYDVLGVLPTGSGKSLCYQLPATILPGLTVVVSPLISLMIDQVRQIKAYHFKEVAALHSFQHVNERKNILTNLSKYKLLFLSPELLQQSEVVFRLAREKVSLFCVDEAHCISQWGYDFRPDYLRIRTVIDQLGKPIILALTGSATPTIRDDIMKHLHCPSMKQYIYSMEKKNMTFAVEKLACSEHDKMLYLANYAEKLQKPALIYFSSRNKAEEMTAYLSASQDAGKAAYYHAGMQPEDRLKVQEQFIHDQLDIVCCTSAFGMGINKGNIRTVIHYHPPAQLESFLQQVGRAGRDGKASLSLVLYRESDVNVPLSLIESELPERPELVFVFRQLKELEAKGEKLPTGKETLEELFQLPETKWRLLLYQLERHRIVDGEIAPFDQEKWSAAFQSIHTFCVERRGYKRRKMNEVIQWLESESCLRLHLYQLFQENVGSRANQCCSNCGYDVSEFQSPVQSTNPNHEKSWQNKLKTIFLIGDISDAKPK